MAIKQHNWFKKTTWMYHPVSWQAKALTLLLLVFMAHIYIAVSAHVDTASDLLYGIFPFWVPAILAWLWVGSQTSHGSK